MQEISEIDVDQNTGNFNRIDNVILQLYTTKRKSRSNNFKYVLSVRIRITHKGKLSQWRDINNMNINNINNNNINISNININNININNININNININNINGIFKQKYKQCNQM